MYTNGYTHQQYLSVVPFVDFAGHTHAYLEADFAAQSEHITLETFLSDTVISYSDKRGEYRTFTGV